MIRVSNIRTLSERAHIGRQYWDQLLGLLSNSSGFKAGSLRRPIWLVDCRPKFYSNTLSYNSPSSLSVNCTNMFVLICFVFSRDNQHKPHHQFTTRLLLLVAFMFQITTTRHSATDVSLTPDYSAPEIFIRLHSTCKGKVLPDALTK
jgi:hypothetical protein